jgi:uncharacterized protein (TIGR02147 family)
MENEAVHSSENIGLNENVGSFFSTYFDKRKAENRHFSIRSLARRLNLSPTYTHQIIRGTRLPSPDVCVRLCEFLDIDTDKRDYILHSVLRGKGFSTSVARQTIHREDFVNGSRINWTPALKSQFGLLDAWHFIPVLECTRLHDYNGTPEFIARRLGLELEKVTSAVDLLLKSGLMMKAADTGWPVKSDDDVEYSSLQDKTKIRDYHKMCLEAVKQCLESQTSPEDVERRLVLNLNFTCDKDLVPMLKQRLKEFVENTYREFSEQGTSNEVYQVSVQLVPLTKRD